MCGIFGIITNRPRAEVAGPVTQASRALAHRGPDDEGIEFISGQQDGLTVAFAHRRLAILDLSPAGHQPMRDEATGNWITYNGEVFNFREARQRLENRGLTFHSESDTEVLLKGFGKLGEAAITDWRGMFAFGFWEAQARQLTLVRDRLGIKPLYYFHDGETFLFASEIRALLATGLVPRKLSPAALDSFLAFGSVQQPLTIIENVYAVLPGHTLTFKDGKIRSTPYWQLRADACPQPVNDERTLSAEIGELLREAVRLRLVSDVPVGVFLSGGIDSSAIVAMLHRAAEGRLKTFSVCFTEQEFSERAHAAQVAQAFETDHTEVLLTADDLLTRLPSALRAMDQPSVDGVNSYVVSEAAASAGLKVAVSGLGGDEVFAGYSLFRTIARDERRRAMIQSVPLGLRRAAAAAIQATTHGNRATKLGSLLRSEQLGEHAVMLHRQLFTGEQRRSLLKTDGSGAAAQDQARLAAWTQQRLANCAEGDLINQASALELGGYLGNTLLRDTDAMSMAHGLEVRVPLIDHRVIERLLDVPGQLKLRDGEPKWLLVEAAEKLPREIVARPKRGFELPFRHWLLGALRKQVETALCEPEFGGLLQASAVRSLWQDFTAGRVSWSRVWSLYVLGEWTKLNLQNRTW